MAEYPLLEEGLLSNQSPSTSLIICSTLLKARSTRGVKCIAKKTPDGIGLEQPAPPDYLDSGPKNF